MGAAPSSDTEEKKWYNIKTKQIYDVKFLPPVATKGSDQLVLPRLTIDYPFHLTATIRPDGTINGRIVHIFINLVEDITGMYKGNTITIDGFHTKNLTLIYSIL
jgi:hypothetical protein